MADLDEKALTKAMEHIPGADPSYCRNIAERVVRAYEAERAKSLPDMIQCLADRLEGWARVGSGSMAQCQDCEDASILIKRLAAQVARLSSKHSLPSDVREVVERLRAGVWQDRLIARVPRELLTEAATIIETLARGQEEAIKDRDWLWGTALCQTLDTAQIKAVTQWFEENRPDKPAAQGGE